MLLPDNIHPDRTIYYNAAFVIQSLKRGLGYNLVDLYQEVKQERSMTFPVFILCIDWLYLLDVVKLNQKGEVELCS